VQLGRNRVEALTDGVFAVAMTLLVLDIKVPELAQQLASAELPYRLLALWPKFLSYGISFVILGVYWVGHHLQLSFIRSADRPLLWINILFLLWVALVPFSTALLSEYTKNRLAIAVYGGNMIAIGLTLALHWWYATSRRRHVDPDVHPGLVRAAMVRVLMGPLLYLVAIGLSFLSPELSLALCALVPVLYVLPGRLDIHWGTRRHEKPKPDQAAAK
jgi:TMEM175 potassium channel family protein